MPNKENLIPQAHVLTVEEASKGGKNSGEARRKKKTLRETAETMLACELPPDVKRKLKSNGLEAEDYKDAVIAAAIQSIIRGNSNMFGQFVKLMGEGSETINLEVNDDSTKNMDNWLNDERNAFKSDK